MTEKELYQIYSGWTGTLHFWVIRELETHLDCEYFPQNHEFKVYSGFVEEYTTATGIPGLARPASERSETIHLYRAVDNPSLDDLEELFKQICLAAARVLKVRRRIGLPEAGAGACAGSELVGRIADSERPRGGRTLADLEAGGQDQPT